MDFIRFRCACGRRLKAAPSLSGREAKCPDCGAASVIPDRDSDRDCPHCGEPIDPPPRARRKCPRCREWISVTTRGLMRPEDAKRYYKHRGVCLAASRLLLPTVMVGPPGKRHTLREVTAFMPAGPPDVVPYSGAVDPVIEIDGGVYMPGVSIGGGSLAAILRAIAAGKFSGFTKYDPKTGQPL